MRLRVTKRAHDGFRRLNPGDVITVPDDFNLSKCSWAEKIEIAAKPEAEPKPDESSDEEPKPEPAPKPAKKASKKASKKKAKKKTAG